jgi:hypothetical protein
MAKNSINTLVSIRRFLTRQAPKAGPHPPILTQRLEDPWPPFGLPMDGRGCYATTEAQVTKKTTKQSHLATANEMFKDAFRIIKTRFAKKNPELTEEQLTKMTAEYFRGNADAGKS